MSTALKEKLNDTGYNNESLPKTKEYLLFVDGTLEDYYNLEEKKADFIDGVIVMHSPASVRHEKTFGNLFSKMFIFAKERKLGEVLGCKLTIVLGENRFEPDIVFIAKKNDGVFTEDEFIGAPDLVVEILSKTTMSYDLKTKREFYQEYKIKEIIFVNPKEEKIMIDVLEGDKYCSLHITGRESYKSKILKGFNIKCKIE